MRGRKLTCLNYMFEYIRENSAVYKVNFMLLTADLMFLSARNGIKGTEERPHSAWFSHFILHVGYIYGNL